MRIIETDMMRRRANIVKKSQTDWYKAAAWVFLVLVLVLNIICSEIGIG